MGSCWSRCGVGRERGSGGPATPRLEGVSSERGQEAPSAVPPSGPTCPSGAGTAEGEWGTPSSVATASDEEPKAYGEDSVALVEELGGCRGPKAQLDAAFTLGEIFSSWIPDEEGDVDEQRDESGAVEAVPVGEGSAVLPAWALGKAVPALLRLAGDVGAKAKARSYALRALYRLGDPSCRFHAATIRPILRLREQHLESLLSCFDLPDQPTPAEQDLIFHAITFFRTDEVEDGEETQKPPPPALLAALHKLLRRLNQNPQAATLHPPRQNYCGCEDFAVNDVRHFLLHGLRAGKSFLLRPDVMLGQPGLVAEYVRYADGAGGVGELYLCSLVEDFQWDIGGEPVLGFPWSEDPTAPVSAKRLLLLTDFALVEGLGRAWVGCLRPDAVELPLAAVEEPDWEVPLGLLCEFADGLGRLLDPAVFSLPVRRERALALGELGLAGNLPSLRHLADHIAQGNYDADVADGGVCLQDLVDRYEAALRQPTSTLAALTHIPFPLR